MSSTPLSCLPDGGSSGVNASTPNWYCPFKVPPEFLQSVPPLVYLAGLDIDKNPVHRGIWEIIKLKPSTKDFQPTYVDVPLDNKFPLKKPKNEQIENYSPKGILKSNWIKKHLQLIPSVVVAFFDMNWTDPYWNDIKNECAKRVRELKTDLAPHGTHILIMLIKTAEAGEDNFSTDRASALCAAADIPPKALYILSHTHTERIQACVQRLELGMKEASKSYYSGRIRRVKNWKDRTQDAALLARYNFKTAFFQEIRRDYVTALSHYHTAHELLKGMRVTDTNVQQIRCVSSWINYRICRLNFLKLDYKESQNMFEKHIRSFKGLEGNKNILFEQLAWLQMQYTLFGDLLRQFYRPGMTSLDPVTYFLAAVDFSDKRGEYCRIHLKDLKDSEWPEKMLQYKKDCEVEFVGQRPWGESLEDTTEDADGVGVVRIVEAGYKHSEDKIVNLGVASEFCKDQQRMRTRCQLMMMMGIEFFAEAEYHRAIMLMTHVLREFGRDRGTVLLYLVAECGLRAACCDGDVPSYLSFLVFLLKRDFEHLVTSQRQELLWTKLQDVLNKKIPSPEDGCVINQEKWRTSVETPYVSYVGVHREGIVEGSFSFSSEILRVAQPAEVKVVLLNKMNFPIPIVKVGVGVSITDYSCEESTDGVVLQPGQSHELSLFFTPALKDVGKIIQVHLGYIDIGKQGSSIVLHYSAVMGVSPYLWSDGRKEKGKQIIAKIEPTVPLLHPKISRHDPMLVNEWHKVMVSWVNTDSEEVTKVLVTILVSTSDPSDIILTTTPQRPGKFGTLTYSTEVERLPGNGSIDTVVYIKCMRPRTSEFQMVTKVKYVDHLKQQMTNEIVEPMELVRPFEIVQKVKNLETDENASVLENEEFILHFSVKNVGKTKLQIVNAKVNNWLPCVKPTVVPQADLTDIVFDEGETLELALGVVLTGPVEPTMGLLDIYWRREEERDMPPCLTQIPITPVPTNKAAALYVQGVFNCDGRGALKRPLPIKYTIHNHSSHVYDLWVSLDSSECFMNAGPKRTRAKITAMETLEMHFILFPLKTGLLNTPRLLIDCVKSNTESNTVNPDIPLVVHRNVVKHIFVSRAESNQPVISELPL